MPLTYTPTAMMLLTDPVAVPDGDPGLYELTTVLADSRAYSRAASVGQLVWSETFRAYGTAAAPRVQLGSILTVTLSNGTDWRTYSQVGGTVLTEGEVTTPVGGPLAINTWFYVYAYVDVGGSALFFEITDVSTNTAAPYERRLWKNAQTANYRYLGCFRTDNAGDVIPVRAIRGAYTYDRSAANALVLFEMFGGAPAPAVWTTVPLLINAVTAVPLHARLAAMQVELVDAVGGHILTRTDAADAGSAPWPITDTTHDTGYFMQPLENGATFQVIDGGGASVVDEVYLTVEGWRE